MSSLQLPVEIWRNILDECMPLPCFLDPGHIPELTDPLYTYDVRSWMDQDYWKIERHRNILRRVCKSWGAYLRHFEHRYVRINDIWHRDIPRDALRKAKRIGYRPCPRGNLCDQCEGSPKNWRRFVPLLKSLGELPVKILDIEDEVTRSVPEVILEASTYLPQLEVILRCQAENGDWIRSLNTLPNLRFIRVDDHFNVNRTGWPTFQALNLTVLSFYNLWNPFSILPHGCSLPSLRHLRFTRFPLSQTDLSSHMLDLIRILEVHGRNLSSLQLGNPIFYHEVKIPGELWTLCPRLERLDTCLGFSTNPVQLPPEENNLKILSFAIDDFIYLKVDTHSLDDPPFHPSLIARCSKLTHLIAASEWSESAKGMRLFDRCNANPWMRELVEACREYGVRLEDRYSNLFDDSELSRLLGIESREEISD